MAAGDVTTRAVCSAPAAAPLILKDGPDPPHVRPSGACLYFSQLALGKGFVKKKKEEKGRARFRRFSARARADFWGGGVGWRENNEGCRTVGQKRKRQITIGVVRLQNHPNCTFRPPKLQSECAPTIVGREFNPTLTHRLNTSILDLSNRTVWEAVSTSNHFQNHFQVTSAAVTRRGDQSRLLIGARGK